MTAILALDMAMHTDAFNVGVGHIIITVCKECNSMRLSLVETPESEHIKPGYVYLCQDCGWQYDATVTECTITFEQATKVDPDFDPYKDFDRESFLGVGAAVRDALAHAMLGTVQPEQSLSSDQPLLPPLEESDHE